MPKISRDHTNEYKTKDEFRGASNILVLAPLTPDGNQGYMELVASPLVDDTSLAAVTYTQPPEQLLSD